MNVEIQYLNFGYQTNRSNTLFVSAHNWLEKVFANKGSVVQDINRIQTRGGLTTVHWLRMTWHYCQDNIRLCFEPEQGNVTGWNGLWQQIIDPGWTRLYQKWSCLTLADFLDQVYCLSLLHSCRASFKRSWNLNLSLYLFLVLCCCLYFDA